MKTQVETLEDNKTKVQVEIPASEVDKKLNAVYKDIARKYNFPGFRKGKAPRQVIDGAFGKEAVLAQATEDLINDAYPQVIEQERLYPVGSPDFTNDDMVEPGKDFTFEFTVGKKLEVELTSYEPIELEVPSAEVNDAEIDDQLEAISHHYMDYSDAKSGTAFSKENFAILDIKATKEDGTDIESLTSQSRFYVPDGGLFSSAFDEEVYGMKAGDEKKFALDVPEDEDAMLMSDLAGQKIAFEVKCTNIQVQSAPDISDEWVKNNMGFESVSQLRDEIKKSISNQKESVIPQIKENSCAAKLVERVEEDVPEDMAQEAESELLQDFFSQLQKQGISFDAYLAGRGIDSDQFKEDIKLQANDEAKQQLALDAWAKKFNIEVTDEEVTAEFEHAGVDNPKKVEEEWRKSGRLYLIREGIVRRKAMENVIETAKITETEYKKDKDAEENPKEKDAEEEADKKSKSTKTKDAKTKDAANKEKDAEEDAKKD